LAVVGRETLAELIIESWSPSLLGVKVTKFFGVLEANSIAFESFREIDLIIGLPFSLTAIPSKKTIEVCENITFGTNGGIC
jgi:hypothetical protein